jgi:hypothetical protein
MTAGEESFFSRWSRRKAQARAGGAPTDPDPPVTEAARPAVAVPPPHENAPTPPDAVDRGAAQAPGAKAAEPPPTLEDVQRLTPEADFRRFVAPDVAPEVRNAALRRLFTDPHFNTMDGLDVYIEDYSRPDPLPIALARRMVAAQFVGLFADRTDAAAARETDASVPPGAVAVPEAGAVVAETETPGENPPGPPAPTPAGSVPTSPDTPAAST